MVFFCKKQKLTKLQQREQKDGRGAWPPLVPDAPQGMLGRVFALSVGENEQIETRRSGFASA